MWMTGEIKGRYFMKIRRFIAAVLAILALAAFAGCKKHDKDQTVTTGKNDETVSEDSSESTASVADVNADIKTPGIFSASTSTGGITGTKSATDFKTVRSILHFGKRNITHAEI